MQNLKVSNCQWSDEVKKRISIHIGGFHASKEPTVIDTLLGSCVAVCLYDHVVSIGGMNHILLPGKADLQHFDNVARYAINAMELLINKVMTLGGERQHLVAKVFGGAHVLRAVSPENGMGAKNSEFVLEFWKWRPSESSARTLGGAKPEGYTSTQIRAKSFLKAFLSHVTRI